MPVNIYDTPADAQFINTYERMPVDAMMQAGIAMQDRWDRGEAAQDALEEALDIDVNQWRIPEKREAVGKYKEKINALIEEVEGEYHKALPGLERIYKDLQGDLKEGVLGGLQGDYQAREALKAKLEKMKEDKKHPMSEKKAARILAAADRAAKKSGKLQKDEYGTWTEGQYQGITPATQIDVFEGARELLKAIPLMEDEQLGPWLEGKGIPYVKNPQTGEIEVSAVGLPPGSYEAIDATIKGRGTPAQQMAFLQTVFANDPKYRDIIQEETMLAMSELDAAEELQPGIKESRLSDASTTDLATLQRLEEEGIDIYSEEGQDALLNATLERDITNSLISAPIQQAIEAYGKQSVTYDRNKITPSKGKGATDGYDAYTQNLVIGNTIDLVNNTMSGIKFQEKNIEEQKENIKKLQNRLTDAQKAKVANNSTVFDAEIEELNRQLNNAEVELTTSETELRNAYGVADVVDPETGKMITDSYIEEQGKAAYDEQFAKTTEEQQKNPSPFAPSPADAASLARSNRVNALKNLREESLEKAQEQGVFATTKFPYVFTSNSTGEYKTPVGNVNEVNTMDFYQNGGAGWSLVLNGDELQGVAFADYFKDFKDNEGSDLWEGYEPTGEYFVRMTNQVDNNGYPVYTVGVEGKKGDTTKVVSSHLITKGDAGSGEFYNLATALSQSDNVQFRDIGDQMLADIYIKPYLGKLDLQNLKLNQPIGIPGLTDPQTGSQVKLIRTGLGDPTTSEFIAVIDTPEDEESDRDIVITHDGKDARYLPVTNIAGGEEDLYQRLYQFHKGASQEMADKKTQTTAPQTTATTAGDPTITTTPSSTTLPSEDLAGYKKEAKKEAEALGAVEITSNDFDNITISDSAYAPYAQPVVKNFLEFVDQQGLAVEVDGLYRTDAYNKELPDAVENSLHKEALGVDLAVEEGSEKYKDIIKLIESWNNFSNTGYTIEAVHHGSTPHLHIEFVTT